MSHLTPLAGPFLDCHPICLDFGLLWAGLQPAHHCLAHSGMQPGPEHSPSAAKDRNAGKRRAASPPRSSCAWAAMKHGGAGQEEWGVTTSFRGWGGPGHVLPCCRVLARVSRTACLMGPGRCQVPTQTRKLSMSTAQGVEPCRLPSVSGFLQGPQRASEAKATDLRAQDGTSRNREV